MAKRKPALSKVKVIPAGQRIDLASARKVYNDTLPTTWVDFMSVAARSDVPVSTITFFTMVRDAAVETARIQATTAHIRNMANVMIRVADEVERQAVAAPKIKP
jgi:hypothetical protein